MIEVAIQTAIFAKLNADLNKPVYSMGAVPDNAIGQYVVIGADTHNEWDTDDEIGYESTVTIHAWDNDSNTRGFGAIKTLMGQINESLHRASLSVTGYNFIGCQFEFSDAFIDADGVTRHGVMRFRIFTSEV